MFFGFLMSIVKQGIQEKYGIDVDDGFVLMRNKKFFGKVQEQRLRKKALVQEFSEKDPLPKVCELYSINLNVLQIYMIFVYSNMKQNAFAKLY